ncbi:MULTISPECIES: ABC transporter ATP-binding protein [Streptomyces]|uniref:ABC transporter ATP-binding protein n=1 Tax=Streptomyces violaceoruber TaxID=1935 RepID=A0A1V0UJC6_STRVN|nr:MULTISPECIES: ABC transporter ATP-binding protein [Streptomyces]ARF65217.1 ABC transporter ATP-binding protein [Streptomyces violaceoruber]MBD3549620.1 ABC transporter ATP-binding protein [Streptomyces sp. JV180]MBD3552934.1 ABC transporter ATP-binding protein [Streptomyces sp. SP18CM02]
MTPLIECTDVTKKFGDFTALSRLNLTVPQGVVYGYLGPNGAGKSTTIRMLMGLSRPTSGRVRVLGQDPTDPGVRGRIGYLPGELRLDDRLTIGQTLASWGRLRGLTDTAHRDDLVQRFGVDPSRKVRGLSTGNRRKVGLVGAFMARPELLILDEPTNGLDPLMQQVFLTAVEEARDNGQSVLLSSHILSEVERVADQVAVLQGGRLAASGPTKELRRRAAQRFHIAFAEGEEVPLTGLAALDGASAVERRSPDGQEVSLAWAGSPDALLAFLAGRRITTLTAPEPDLEEAFLEYYQNDAPAGRGAAAEEPAGSVRQGVSGGS